VKHPRGFQRLLSNLADGRIAQLASIAGVVEAADAEMARAGREAFDDHILRLPRV